MSYKLEKFLVLLGLFVTAGIIVSIGVGSLSQGFSICAVTAVVAYVLADKIQNG